MVPHYRVLAGFARRARWFVAGAARGCAFAVLFLAAAAMQPLAAAQDTSLEAQRDALFQKMLNDPSDLDTAFAYAAVATRLGDFEGAITALERMLIFAPGLPRVQLELGVLYYRLGSYAAAQTYFESAISAGNVPEIVRQRVARYTAKIKNKQQRHSFSGSLFGGFRVQSNANSGPGSSRINLNGVTFTLDSQSTKKADGNAFFAASLHYDYDLHRQGDLLEADFLFYGAKNFSLEKLDTAVAELTLGPSFNMQRFGLDETQFGVYAIGNAVTLKDKLYFNTLGAGIRFVNRASATRNFRIKTEYRRKWYNNTSERQRASDRDGHDISGEFSAAFVVSSRIMLHTKLRLVREDVKEEFYDNVQAGGELGVTFSLPSPAGKNAAPGRNWLLNLTGGYRHAHYDEPDPSINAAKKQKNNEFFTRASLTIPLAEGVNLMPQVEYRNVNSNYDIYKYENLSATLGIGWQF